MPVKAILFDLDGTIADTLPLCIRAFRAAIEPFAGRSFTDAEIVATFGPSEEGTIDALIPHHYNEGVAAYQQQYEQMHSDYPTCFEGIPALLEELQAKGIRLGMVTGKGPKSAATSLSLFGLQQYFEAVKTGIREGGNKAENILEFLASWPDLKKEEVIYVGDAPSDITACRKAGVAIAAAAWADSAEPETLMSLHPDQIFYSIAEFKSWVDGVTKG